MSLIEMLVALAVAGMMASVGVTSLARFADRARVETAAATLLTAYRRAQGVARAWNRVAELVVAEDSLVIRTGGPGGPSVVWRGPGPLQSGVTLSPTVHVSAFGPSGLGMGAANVTHVLSRGGVRRQLVVSRLGRVRVTP
jgi:prepilin-type N-terminal cleavage/methylation domain-containing protein